MDNEEEILINKINNNLNKLKFKLENSNISSCKKNLFSNTKNSDNYRNILYNINNDDKNSYLKNNDITINQTINNFNTDKFEIEKNLWTKKNDIDLNNTNNFEKMETKDFEQLNNLLNIYNNSENNSNKKVNFNNNTNQINKNNNNLNNINKINNMNIDQSSLEIILIENQNLVKENQFLKNQIKEKDIKYELLYNKYNELLDISK